MALLFPITECPHCKCTEFTVNATLSRTAKLTFDATKGEHSNIAFTSNNWHPNQLRKQWFCKNCNAHLFNTTDVKQQ